MAEENDNTIEQFDRALTWLFTLARRLGSRGPVLFTAAELSDEVGLPFDQLELIVASLVAEELVERHPWNGVWTLTAADDAISDG